MASNLLRLAEVKARTSLGTTTIYKLLKPVKVGGASRWLSEEVDALVQAAKDARDGKEPGMLEQPRAAA